MLFALLIFAMPAGAAPAVTFSSPVDGSTVTDSSLPPELGFTTEVTAVDQACRYDNSPWIECPELWQNYPRLRNGAHSYAVRTTDDLGDVTVDVVTFTIDDSVAPAITIEPEGGSPVADRLRLTITTDDPYARVYVRIDEQGSTRLDLEASPAYWSPGQLGEGAHTATLIAIDGAGNAATATTNFSFADSTAPTVTISSPTDAQQLPTGDLRPQFTSDDENAQFRCNVGGAPPVACSPDAIDRYSNLATGPNSFTVEANDNAGNSSTTTVNFDVTDNNAGTLAIAEPAAAATYTAQPRLVLTYPGSLAPDSLRCSVNGGPFEYCAEGEPLPRVDTNGDWLVKVRAIDENGDQVSDVSAFTVNDTSPPQLSTTPTPAPFTNIDDIAIGALVEDSYADATPSTNAVAQCRLDGGVIEDCFDLLSFVGSPLTNGAHTVQVIASDWVGNAVTAAIAFTIADTTAPTLQIISPADNAAIADDHFTVDYLADSTTASTSCALDAQPAVDCASGADDSSTSWTPRNLSAGAHTLTVTATDRAGNAASASVDVSITAGAAPALDFITPASGATVGDMTVAHFISDKRIFGVRCALDDDTQLAADPQSCAANASDRMTGFYRPDSISAGAHTLWVEITDNQGHATVASLPITVADVEAPDVRIDGFVPAAGAVDSDSPAAVRYSSSDPTAHFTCVLDGQPAVACGTGGSGERKLPQLADGVHGFTVNAIDASGNSSTAVTGFTTADTTPPQLSIPDAFNGMPVGASVTTHPQATGATTVECTIDLDLFASCANGVFTANFETNGQHTLRYRAIDAAGNTTTKTFTVAATLPPGPTPPPSGGGGGAQPAPGTATATFAKLKPKATKAKVTIPVNVTLALPPAVAATAACNGSAKFELKVGKKILKTAGTLLRPVNEKCSASVVLRVKAKPIAGKRFTVTFSFAGNSVIAPVYKATQGKSGKAKSAK